MKNAVIPCFQAIFKKKLCSLFLSLLKIISATKADSVYIGYSYKRIQVSKNLILLKLIRQMTFYLSYEIVPL